MNNHVEYPLIAENVSVTIEKHTIIRNTSLRCKSGEITAISGVSGCGKTTLLNCLGLILTPSSGEILLYGMPTSKWSIKQRESAWKDHIAFIYQDYGVIAEESIGYNIALTAKYARNSQVAAKIENIMRTVGLEHHGIDEPASFLSGGEQQRVAIARSICKKADIIVADEPTASLDTHNRDNIIELFQNLAHHHGYTIVLATHDEYLIERCDQVCILK